MSGAGIEDRTDPLASVDRVQCIQRAAVKRLVTSLLLHAGCAPITQAEHDAALAHVLIEQGVVMVLALRTNVTKEAATAALPALVADIIREVVERYGT